MAVYVPGEGEEEQRVRVEDWGSTANGPEAAAGQHVKGLPEPEDIFGISSCTQFKYNILQLTHVF